MVLRKNKFGFTLIEILIVVSIIAFMAVSAVVLLKNSRMKSRDATRYADLTNLRKALEMYYQDNGQYPFANPYMWRSYCNAPGYHPSQPRMDDPNTGTLGYIPGLAPKYIPILPIDPSGCPGKTTFEGYLYISDPGIDPNHQGYKLAASQAEIGDICGIGETFYDAARCGSNTSCWFCSVFVNGSSGDYKNR